MTSQTLASEVFISKTSSLASFSAEIRFIYVKYLVGSLTGVFFVVEITVAARRKLIFIEGFVEGVIIVEISGMSLLKKSVGYGLAGFRLLRVWIECVGDR